MKKFSIKNKCGGFTLIEVVITIGLLSTVASISMIVSSDNYRKSSFRSERDSIVSFLMTARSQSIHNMCFGTTCIDGKSHGVHVENSNYILFQGNTFALRDTLQDETITSRNNTVFITGLSDIVFSQLSGDVALPGSMNVSDASGNNSIITINSEGQILWTN